MLRCGIAPTLVFLLILVGFHAASEFGVYDEDEDSSYGSYPDMAWHELASLELSYGPRAYKTKPSWCQSHGRIQRQALKFVPSH